MDTVNLLITKAHAVTVGLCIPGKGTECKTTFASFGDYAFTFLLFAERLGAVIVVLSIILGAYIYLTSSGDSTKLNAAKDRVMGAILGYIILILIGAILKYIGIDSP